MAFTNLLSTLTSSLPLPRLGTWDIQVKKETKKAKESDKDIFDKINSVLQGVSRAISLSDVSQSLFGQSDDKYTTVVNFDSFISFNGIRDSSIVSQTIEGGSFRSVNKITKPNVAKVVLAKGGLYKGIEDCLSVLKDLEGSTSILRIVTPFGVMDELNLTQLNYSFKRETGSNLLIAELTLQEVKSQYQKAPYDVKNIKNPQDSNTQNVGLLGVKK
jgi:hypothetical protein